MAMVITWAHRNAELQADTLVDWSAATVTPPAGLSYALQVRDGATLLAEKLDIDGATATVETDFTGPLTFRLWSILDGPASLQAATWTQTQGTPDAVTGTIITADGVTGGGTIPNQPHGEPLVASGISPPVLLTSTDATDYVYSS